MKIVVVGCGKIGETILGALAHEGHDLVAVDNRDTVINEIVNRYDVMCVCGNGVDTEVLSEAGVESAELFIAVTGSDELNMLCCFLAKRMGARHTIARIRNPEYNDRSLSFMKEQLDLSMAINPERLTASALYHMLKLPAAAKVETFSRRNFEMIELRLKDDSPFCGIPLWTLRERHKAKFLICVVQRGNDVFIPNGAFVLEGGDRIGLTAKPSEMQKLLRSLNMNQKQARSIMILGGSRIAFYLAKQLIASGSDVKVIDMDRAICRKFSEEMRGISAICADGTHQEILLEEGLREQDAFLALTGMDEENILVSCYAASQKGPRVIAKVNRDEMAQMAAQVGLDSVVSPKDITVNVVLRYARALQSSVDSAKIETLYQLMDGKAEAVEFAVTEASFVTNKPLKDLPTHKNTLIAGIVRDRTPIIPGGNDMILPGDHVVVISSELRLNELTDILR